MKASAPSTPPVVVDEHACAAAIGLSVSWLRHDRRDKRVIPFCRVGGAIRYNLDRVRETLAELEEGGPQSRAARSAGRQGPR